MEQAPDYPYIEPDKPEIFIECQDCERYIFVGETFFCRDGVFLCKDCLDKYIIEAE